MEWRAGYRVTLPSGGQELSEEAVKSEIGYESSQELRDGSLWKGPLPADWPVLQGVSLLCQCPHITRDCRIIYCFERRQEEDTFPTWQGAERKRQTHLIIREVTDKRHSTPGGSIKVSYRSRELRIGRRNFLTIANWPRRQVYFAAGCRPKIWPLFRCPRRPSDDSDAPDRPRHHLLRDTPPRVQRRRPQALLLQPDMSSDPGCQSRECQGYLIL